VKKENVHVTSMCTTFMNKLQFSTIHVDWGENVCYFLDDLCTWRSNVSCVCCVYISPNCSSLLDLTEYSKFGMCSVFPPPPPNIGAGIAQWYSVGLQAEWSGVWVPVGAGNFSPHHHVQTGSGAYPASYPVGTGGSFLGVKVTGMWSWSLTSI
jgi:hypothetical protein